MSLKISPSQVQVIAIGLMSGKSISSVQKETNQPYKVVRAVADDIGWDPSWRLLANKHRSTLEKDIVRLVIEKGLNLREIGDIHGMSRERVRQILETQGICIKDINHKRLMVTKSLVYEILLSEDMNDKEIGKKLDISPATVYRARQKFTPIQKQRVASAKSMRKEEAEKEYMSLAREMWEDHYVKDIVAAYQNQGHDITVPYFNQLILKYREKYGWFPYKRATSKKKTS